MTNLAIQVHDLSKKYHIGQLNDATSFRAVASHAFKEPMRHIKRRLTGQTAQLQADSTLWALKDLNLNIKFGEVVGIIGHNGSGKSTFLKILSRITKPTTGMVKISGQVGALLEVGTGFHHELTGRENIYFNGSILGMKRVDIAKRFDEIVAFSEIEAFIDTPVKHYSSGMYLRLAFAVAAHLEPEILLIDEVLAVGDVHFQRKCLGKMEDVAEEGRTVLFVSHSMQTIRSLCERAILLDHGTIQDDGDVGQVVKTYLSKNGQLKGDGFIPDSLPRIVGTGEAKLRQVILQDRLGNALNQLYFGQPFQVTTIFEVRQALADVAIEIGISTLDGLRIVTVTSLDNEQPVLNMTPGLWAVTVELDTTLIPGQYTIDVMMHHWLQSKLTVEWVEHTYSFSALDVSAQGNNNHICFAAARSASALRGFVQAESRWHSPTTTHQMLTHPQS